MNEEHSLEYVLEEEVKKLFNKNEEFVSIIDRLEVAISNVLNERDQLLTDIGKMVNDYSSCDFCKYDDGNDFPHGICEYCMKESDQWTWRGVPDNT